VRGDAGAGEGQERGWWHLAIVASLLRLQLGGLASAVVGGVGAVLLVGHDEDPSPQSPQLACHAPTDVSRRLKGGCGGRSAHRGGART
jgi:hypothetical protein